jgi:hypothetical protein
MPLFHSHFYLTCPGGAEHVAQEKVAANMRKRLKQERARKQMERQKCEASSSDADEEDDDEVVVEEEDSKGDDEYLAAL